MSNLHAGAAAGRVAGQVFDRLAATYDRDFTESLIGRAQRDAVWRVALKTFCPGDNLLELNCGTGEDAFFLAAHGISVFACDASPAMIARAEQRLAHKPHAPQVVFCHLPTERIAELNPEERFDGVFSNFSGLNCIAELEPVAASLSGLVKQGDRLLLCFSTRFCLWEILSYSLRGNFGKAFRRWGGSATAVLDGAPLTVHYPTVREISRSFAPHFRLCGQTGIGVAIPPSYLEPVVRRHPMLLRALRCLEPMLAGLPGLCTMGDHMLLCFEKVTP
jgi:ubiquinone/menaquinone biosynthesis C-methylase UbiE